MAQHSIEGGKIVSKEKMINTLMDKDNEDGTMASKREMLSALMEKNIQSGEIVSNAEMPTDIHEEYPIETEAKLKELIEEEMREWVPQDAEADLTDLLELYRAAMKGNWQDVRRIFTANEDAKTAKISNLGMTALHVAASCGRSGFVVEIVKILSPNELEARDQLGRTALHHVALAASMEAAKAMVDKNPYLPYLVDMNNLTPLFYAAKWRHPRQSGRMVGYLHQVTENRESCLPFTGSSATDLIVAIIASRCYDTGLRTLRTYPALAVKKNDQGLSVLRVLATQPSAFPGGKKLSIWKSWKLLIYKLVQVDIEEIQHDHKDSPTDAAKSKNPRGAAVSFFKLVSKYSKGIRKVAKMKQKQLLALELVKEVCKLLKRTDINYVQEYFIPRNETAILHIAIEHGVFELVEMCLDHFPDLIWYADTKSKQLLLHAAIEHRRVRIFNYIIDLTGKNTKAYAELNVAGGNNTLHLAAIKAPTPQLQAVRGPAFQMQLELQWYKAVEAIVYHDLRTKKNDKGQTPHELFLEEHKDLQKDAKDWMKDTSNSCMVVATLVATVAFAAMITVPGGNDSETGMPILARKKLFAAFSIANALSMICSAVSLLMFLSIQTSRNRVEDFLESLPNTLVKGLVFLSIAVVTMMISFGTAIGLSLQSRLNWAYIPITIVACFPAIIFFRLQLPLLLRTVVFRSGPGIFRGQRDRKLWCLRKIGYRLLADDMA